MKKNNKEIEEPALLSDTSTIKKFQDTVLKARLIYDGVEENRKYQAAIAYNLEDPTDNFEQTNQTLIYVDRKSKKVVIEQVEERYNFMEYSISCPYGVIIVSNRYGNLHSRGGVVYGLISYKGVPIIPVENKGIRDVGTKYIFTSALGKKHNHNLYDYNGNLLIEFDGPAWIDSNFQVEGSERLAHVIINQKSRSTEEYESSGSDTRLYTVYNKEIYLSKEIAGYGVTIRRKDEKIQIRRQGVISSQEISEEYDIRQILEMSDKLELVPIQR